MAGMMPSLDHGVLVDDVWLLFTLDKYKFTPYIYTVNKSGK
jgi:hypothetical protein